MDRKDTMVGISERKAARELAKAEQAERVAEAALNVARAERELAEITHRATRYHKSEEAAAGMHAALADAEAKVEKAHAAYEEVAA